MSGKHLYYEQGVTSVQPEGSGFLTGRKLVLRLKQLKLRTSSSSYFQFA